MSIQVLEQLPSNLLSLFLAASCRPVQSILPRIPTSLHMEALHAMHPNITSHSSIYLINRDFASEDDELLWALLPRMAPHLKQFTLKCTAGNIDLNTLSSHLAKLTALTGLSLLHCEADPDDFIALGAAIGGLSELKYLALVDMHLEVQGSQALAPHLENLTKLEHLDVSVNEVCDEAASALAGSLPVLGSLRELILDNNFFKKHGLGAVLSHISALERLEHLSLRCCDINSAGWWEVAPYVHKCTGLTSLLLGWGGSSCESRWTDANFLISIVGRLVNLQVLDLSGRVVCDDCVRDLLRGFPNPSPLRKLHLANTLLMKEGAEALAGHFFTLVQLEELDLRSCYISTHGVKALARHFEHLTALTSLDLSYNRLLDAAGFTELARHMSSLHNLKCLVLRSCDRLECLVGHLTNPNVVEVWQGIKTLSCLQHLDMGRSLSAKPEHVGSFEPLLGGLTRLQYLDLEEHFEEYRDFELLAQHLSSLHQLSGLNLSRNPLSGEGMTALAPVLSILTGLVTLALSKCGITGGKAAASLASCFQSFSRLRCLSLERNELGDQGAGEFQNT